MPAETTPEPASDQYAEETARVRTQYHVGFLGGDVCYQVDEIAAGTMLTRGWQRHHAIQDLVPLRGQFRLEICSDAGQLATKLESGQRYTLPAGLEHRLLTEGGLLERFLLDTEEAVANGESWGPADSAHQISALEGGPFALVRRTPRPGASGRDGRVEVDVHVPGTKLARKVYFAPERRPRKIRTHCHRSSHMLVGIVGTVWVASQESDNPVQLHGIVRGETYSVPAGLPHQLRLEPRSVLASYFPARSWFSPEEDLHELDEDWLP